MINYAEYYVEIYVLSYTVMNGWSLKRWDESNLAYIYIYINQQYHVYCYIPYYCLRPRILC